MNQQELLNTQTNAEEADNLKSNSKPLIEREQIPNTPFWVIGNKEKGYFVIMGQYKIIETQKTKALAIGQLEADKWKITIRIAGIIAETAIAEDRKIATQTIEEMYGKYIAKKHNETNK